MNFVLTNNGRAAIDASPNVPPILALFKLGSSVNYVPSSADVDIHGTQVWSGTPSLGVVQSSNVLKYTFYLDPNVGDFAFGEIGLYLPGNVLFALGSASSLINKLRTTNSSVGNNIVLDCYVSTSGTNYSVHAEIGNSSNPLNLSAVASVDALPSAFAALPNVYTAPSPDGNGSILAFATNGVWNLTSYEEVIATKVIVGVTPTSITVGTESSPPAFPGELVLQIIDGPYSGCIRVISGYSSSNFTFTFDTPLTGLPGVNNTIQIIRRSKTRPLVAAILAGLDAALTAGHINDLVNYPLNTMISRNGGVAMQAPLNVGGHRVINLASPILDTDAANKVYVDSRLSSNATLVTSMSQALSAIQSQYLRKDGGIPMTGNLNMGGQRIVNVQSPVAPTDAATKAYTDSAVGNAMSGIVSVHNSLSGLQGGTSGERYHLTAEERSFLQDFLTSGFPDAGYGGQGIVQLASAAATGAGLSMTTAITPESLYQALSSATNNALQNAAMEALRLHGNFSQVGNGAPTGSTPAYPPFYLDISANPSNLYMRVSNVWREVHTREVQFGTGAPSPTTSVNPRIYFNTSVTPWKMYVYNSGAWSQFYTPYIQYGVGSPGVSTPVEPSLYVDVSNPSSYVTWVFYGGTWTTSSSASSQQTGYEELYFISQS